MQHTLTDFKNQLSAIAGKHTRAMPPATHISGMLAKYERLTKFNDELKAAAQAELDNLQSSLPDGEEKEKARQEIRQAFKECSDGFYRLHFK